MAIFEVCKCGHTKQAHHFNGNCLFESSGNCHCDGYEFGFFRESGRDDGKIVYYDNEGHEIYRI
jgi:hypothetical protein